MNYKIQYQTTPRCKTRRGCPVSDIAPNPKAEKFIQTYIKAKQLTRIQGTEKTVSAMLETIGILDDPDLLFEFELLWLEHVKQQREAQNAKKK